MWQSESHVKPWVQTRKYDSAVWCGIVIPHRSWGIYWVPYENEQQRNGHILCAIKKGMEWEERSEKCQIWINTQFDGVKNGLYIGTLNKQRDKNQNANKPKYKTKTGNNAHHRFKIYIGRFHVVRTRISIRDLDLKKKKVPHFFVK